MALFDSLQRLKDALSKTAQRTSKRVRSGVRDLPANIKFVAEKATDPVRYSSRAASTQKLFSDMNQKDTGLATPILQRLSSSIKNSPTAARIQENIERVPAIPKFSEGFTEGSTLSLYDLPYRPSQNAGESLAYGAGYTTSLLNPFNPVNKLGILSGLERAGGKATTAAVSRLAPRATGAFATKVLPVLGGEAAQGLAYGGASAAANRLGGTNEYKLKDFGTDVLAGALLRGAGSKLLPKIAQQANKANFSLDNLTRRELEEAEDQFLNPDNWLGKIKDLPKARTIKEARKNIKERRRDTIERLAEKYLPDKQFNKLRNPQAKIRALIDLSADNRLANVPGMGIVNKANDANGSLYDIEKKIGYTNNPEKSLYLTKDGKYLNTGSGDDVMHDEFVDSLKKGITQEDYAKNTGSLEIRYDPRELDVRVYSEPTTAQLKQIENLSRNTKQVFIEDFTGGVKKDYSSADNNLRDFFVRNVAQPPVSDIPNTMGFVNSNSPIMGFVSDPGATKATRGAVKRIDNLRQQKSVQAQQMRRAGASEEQVQAFLRGNDAQPKQTLLKKAQELDEKAQPQLEQARATAEVAQAERSLYSNQTIKDINRLKQKATGRAFQEGDIETLRKQDPELVENVTQSVKEVRGDHLSDEEALDIALSLPTKQETRIQLPDDLKEARKLRQEAKQLQDRVVNAQASPETVGKILKRRQKDFERAAKAEYNEWQKAVFQQQSAKRKTEQDIVRALRKNIKSPLAKNVDQLKDVSGLKANFRDIYRNLQEVYGNRFGQVKQILLDPFDKAKGRFVKEQEQILNSLDNNVVNKYNIKKGSKESAAIQNFGEGKRDYESLVKEFGETKARQIQEADRWFRKEYDRLLTEVNETRRRIYPNNPEKIIPKRKDYYRHFQEMAEGFRGLANIFETPANIESTLAGISYDTKPKARWLSFAQKRLGNTTDEDAIGGFLDYIKAATYAKHVDPFIPQFRGLADELADATERTPENADVAGSLNNTILLLNRYADDLSGKTNAGDRYVQEIIGRKPMAVMNWVNNRVKANVILGNVSSSLAQIFNVPQALANINNPRIWAQGAKDTFETLFKNDAPIKQSDFINERYFDAYEKFDTGMLNNTKKFATWMIKALDEVGTKYTWNMHYRQALEQGINNPAKYADDATRRLVAGRGIGEVPLAQKGKIFQLIAPFQLEVANTWWVMKDFVDEKKFGKIATFLVASYLFNRSAQKIRGSDVSFDPINAVLEGVEAYREEGDTRTGAIRAGGRIAGEVLSNLPGGQTVAATYPEFGNKEWGLPTRQELFGEGDPTRYGSGLLAAKGIQDPIYKLLFPFGGQQVKRTKQGVEALNKGYSETQTGKIRYPVEQNARNILQGSVFGQYAVPEAQQYFKEDRRPLGDKQSQKAKESGNVRGYYNRVQIERENSNQRDLAKEQLKGIVNGQQPDFTNIQPRNAAIEFYKAIDAAPKDDRKATYEALAPYMTPEIAQELNAVLTLASEGASTADIDIALVPEEVRARAIKERLDELTKENRRKKLELYIRMGYLNPTIEAELARLINEK